MSTPRGGRAASAIGLLEEVFQTAKALPLSSWAIYYAATFPLVLAFLYFWADMTNHAFAHERLVTWATALSVLFLVAKTGHAVFAHLVVTHATGDADRPRPRLAPLAMNQAIIQCTGLVLLPMALVAVAPFGWLYAVYQNATALDDGRRGLRELVREARVQAGINAKQSNVTLWLICPAGVPVVAVFILLVIPIMRSFSPEWTEGILALYTGFLALVLVPLCPFAVVVAVNLAAALMIVPQLLKMVFGIDTAFSISPSGAVNPTLFIIVSGMTYLCLDPLIKIAYALRCYYGDSIRTGKDLRVKIDRIAQRGLVLIAVAAGSLCASPAPAQDPADQAGEVAALDRAIETTLHDSRFAWRMPRQRPQASDNTVMRAIADSVENSAEWIGEKIIAIQVWLRKLFDRPEKDNPGSSAAATRVLRVAAVALLAALLATLLFIAWKTWRRTTVVETNAAEARPAPPDIEDEGTSADALASAEWLKLAAELLARGEVRLAMRAYFFAGLARLGQLRLIRIAAYKSNREYVRELRRIDHARRGLVDNFHANLRVFESVWYGDHGLGPDELRSYVRAMEGISACE